MNELLKGPLPDIAIAVLGGLITIFLVAIWNRISVWVWAQLRRVYSRLVLMSPILRQITIGVTGAAVAVLLWNGTHLQTRLFWLEARVVETQTATVGLQKHLSTLEGRSEASISQIRDRLSGLEATAAATREATVGLQQRLSESEATSRAVLSDLEGRLSRLETIPPVNQLATNDLQERVSGLEATVVTTREATVGLQQRLSESEATSRAVLPDLEGRLSKLETIPPVNQLATNDLQERVSGLEATVATIQETTADLQQRLSESEAMKMSHGVTVDFSRDFSELARGAPIPRTYTIKGMQFTAHDSSFLPTVHSMGYVFPHAGVTIELPIKAQRIEIDICLFGGDIFIEARNSRGVWVLERQVTSQNSCTDIVVRGDEILAIRLYGGSNEASIERLNVR